MKHKFSWKKEKKWEIILSTACSILTDKDTKLENKNTLASQHTYILPVFNLLQGQKQPMATKAQD